MKLLEIIQPSNKICYIGARNNDVGVEIRFNDEINVLLSINNKLFESENWEPISIEYFDFQEAIHQMKQGKILGKKLMTGYTYKIENNKIHAYYKGKIDTDYDVNSIGFSHILDKQWFIVD